MTITANATQALSRFDPTPPVTASASISVNGLERRRSARRPGPRDHAVPAVVEGQALRGDRQRISGAPEEAQREQRPQHAFVITPTGRRRSRQPPARMSSCRPKTIRATRRRSRSVSTSRPATTPVATASCVAGDRERANTLVYQQHQPMATELIALAVGGYKVIDRGGHAGVYVRDVIAPSLRADARRQAPGRDRPSSPGWRRASALYPFGSYGSFVINARSARAGDAVALDLRPPGVRRAATRWPTTMLHEPAHLWFGDSVSPREWSECGSTRAMPPSMSGVMRAERWRVDEWPAASRTVQRPMKYYDEQATSTARRSSRSRSRSAATLGTCSPQQYAVARSARRAAREGRRLATLARSSARG